MHKREEAKKEEDTLELPGIIGSKIVFNEKPQNKKSPKDISDPEKFMREMMGKDYSILINEESEKMKAAENINLHSFIPVTEEKKSAQPLAKSEDDKNLFTVIEENTINENAGVISDNDIVDDSNSFASDDSEESADLDDDIKHNRRTISDGYKDEEREVLVQDFDDDIETTLEDMKNREETLEEKEIKYKKMLAELEQHKKEVAKKIPLEVIEKFCGMTKDNQSLVRVRVNVSQQKMKTYYRNG